MAAANEADVVSHALTHLSAPPLSPGRQGAGDLPASPGGGPPLPPRPRDNTGASPGAPGRRAAAAGRY